MQHSYMHVGVSYVVGRKNREYYWIPEIPHTRETARMLVKTLSHTQNWCASLEHEEKYYTYWQFFWVFYFIFYVQHPEHLPVNFLPSAFSAPSLCRMLRKRAKHASSKVTCVTTAFISWLAFSIPPCLSNAASTAWRVIRSLSISFPPNHLKSTIPPDRNSTVFGRHCSSARSSGDFPLILLAAQRSCCDRLA